MRFNWIFALLALFTVTATSHAQYYEYDPDDPKAPPGLREGEKPIIPMDTNDPGYNVWQTPNPELTKGREPGLINIQRFPGGAGFTGIPTFFKLPIALTPADLAA